MGQKGGWNACVRLCGVGVLAMVAGSGMRAMAQQGAATGATSAPSAGQDFRLQVKSQIVLLDVVVTDKNGHNVKGLTKDDFTVFEDKVPETIRSFEETEPPAPGAPGPIEVHSTEELDRKAPNAPVSILVLDELTTRHEDLAFALYSLKKYLDAQGETLQQPTMLVTANYRNIAVLQDYTTSKAAVVEALEHHLPPLIASTRARSSTWAQEQITATFGSLISVAQATAGHPGHKNMIWVGRGLPPMNVKAMEPEMLAAFNRNLELSANILKESRVTLYSIDPSGLSTELPQTDQAAFQVSSYFGGEVNFETIVTETGGKALHNRNDVDQQIDTAVRDGESFYTMSYVPTVESDAAKAFRRIRVVMKNPELTATTREGYFTVTPPVAPAKTADGQVSRRLIFDFNAASNGLLVYDGIRLTILRDATNPDKFIVKMSASDLPLKMDATQKEGAELTVLVESFDKKGKLLNHNARILTLHMRDEAPQGGPDTRPVGVEETISTAAPATRLRFVVRANADGRIGTENFYLVDPKVVAEK